MSNLIIADIVAGKEVARAIEKFTPNQQFNTQVWRITNDPTMKDWANYHNANPWSPDGRYLAYTHFALHRPLDEAEVRYYDLQRQVEVHLDTGQFPRWAKKHNWLFWATPDGKLMRLNFDNGKTVAIAVDVSIGDLGETDADDRYIYFTTPVDKKGRVDNRMYRVRIDPNATPELMPEGKGIFALPNPQHPAVLLRTDVLLPKARRLDDSFSPLHIAVDLDGSNGHMLEPNLNHAHQIWSGDG